MSDEYFISTAIILSLQLAALYATLYQFYVREKRRQRQHKHEVRQPEDIYIALSHLTEEIREWRRDHTDLPLNHPDIQISVNRVVGITGYILETCEHVPNASYLKKWHDDLLPFVGVIGEQKESG